MKFSIIIIHWRTPKSLNKLLSLLKGHNLEVIVIDNSKTNGGFARACNLGALRASGDWLLFLNPDVEIRPEQIRGMVKYATEHKLDACSPEPTSKNYVKPIPSWLSLLVEFSPLHRFVPLSIFRSRTLTGGVLLIKSSVLRSLGGLDERFFLWFEDSDLTKRLINMNYKIGFIPISIKHGGGESFNKLDEQFKRDIFFNSMDIYAQKHFSSFGKLIVKLIKKRFTKREVLPEVFDGVSITVPNMKKNILVDFFEKNKSNLSAINELIIVSSAINDDVWEWRRKYPFVRFIPIDINRGVASTINIGLRVSTGRWIGTMNDDVILNGNWIDECLKCQNESAGCLNPVIFNTKGMIESAGVSVLKRGKAEPIKSKDAIKSCCETDAVNGASVLYSKEVLSQVGIFDERFGSYLEDIDLSLRIKRAGFKNIVVQTASVIHEGHRTAAKFFGIKKQFLDFRNWFYVIGKNWSLRDLVLNFPAIILERLRNLSGIIKNII